MSVEPIDFAGKEGLDMYVLFLRTANKSCI